MSAAEARRSAALPDGADTGVDLVALERWLRQRFGHDGALSGIQVLGGGTQNMMIGFSFAGRSLVLRHPPRHKRPESDEVIRREVRMLGVLDDTDVPRPQLRGACLDTTVLGSVFYVMDHIPGFNPVEELPLPLSSDPDWQHAVGLGVADALGRLGRVPPEPAVDAGFRPPQGWLERQPARWLTQLRSYAATDLLAAGEALADWLSRRVPRTWQPGIVHGDYNLGNVLIRPDRPAVAAIVDWELSTLGDPLLDLAHLLAGWPVDNPHTLYPGLARLALPGHDDLVEAWARVAGRDVHDLDWYRVLACFRLGALLEGTYARSLAGLAPTEVGTRLHGLSVGLFAQARGIVGARR